MNSNGLSNKGKASLKKTVYKFPNDLPSCGRPIIGSERRYSELCWESKIPGCPSCASAHTKLCSRSPRPRHLKQMRALLKCSYAAWIADPFTRRVAIDDAGSVISADFLLLTFWSLCLYQSGLIGVIASVMQMRLLFHRDISLLEITKHASVPYSSRYQHVLWRTW